MAPNAPRVGVGVILRLHGTNRVLVGKRKGNLGAGTYAVPGGHLEFGESFEECAIRETEEETGIKLASVHFCYAVNTVFDNNTHYVTIFMGGEVPSNTEAKLMEPHKCEGWQWVADDAIPHPCFKPLERLIGETRISELLPPCC